MSVYLRRRGRSLAWLGCRPGDKPRCRCAGDPGRGKPREFKSRRPHPWIPQLNRGNAYVELSVSRRDPGKHLPRLCGDHDSPVLRLALVACPPAQLKQFKPLARKLQQVGKTRRGAYAANYMRSEVPSYIHTPPWLISIGLDSAAVDKPYAAVYSAPPRLNLMPQAPRRPPSVCADTTYIQPHRSPCRSRAKPLVPGFKFRRPHWLLHLLCVIFSTSCLPALKAYINYSSGYSTFPPPAPHNTYGLLLSV
jgi:hypothetical protein